MRPLERQRCLQALQEHFGVKAFRPGQEQAVEALLHGRDLLCLFPTGAGKSLCYQLPALLLQGPTLVISPLIALMRDQVASLNARHIPALCLDSLQTQEEQRASLLKASQGQYRLLYVSPERLQSPLFQGLMAAHPPQLVVVDEAHCVVSWGEGFRPAYQDIGRFVEGLPQRPTLCAMTATADRRMRLAIQHSLGMQRPRVLTLPLLRPNLRYRLATTTDTTGWLKSFLRGTAGKGLIFCRSRAGCERRAEVLRYALGGEGVPLRVGYYHAGMEKQQRMDVQRQFSEGRLQVLCCTSAFGMGVDIPDIRWVVHLYLPDNVADYAQQSGRAGRDGQAAQCVMLLDPLELERCRKRLTREKQGLRRHPVQRLALRRKATEQQRLIEALTTARCIPAALSAGLGRRERPCCQCSACRRDKAQRPPKLPYLWQADQAAIPRWALTWERQVIARRLHLPALQVLTQDALERAARSGHLPAQGCHPAAAPTLERLLDHLRVKG